MEKEGTYEGGEGRKREGGEGGKLVKKGGEGRKEGRWRKREDGKKMEVKKRR